MMPVNDFPGVNTTLQRPVNMTEEECMPLSACVVSSFRGMQFTTCWQPSYEDVKALEAGKSVVVEIGIKDPIFANVDTRQHNYPPLMAVGGAVVWMPGPIEMADLKSGMRIYITFVCKSFPVIRVYVNE
jgi:hypothetical protein